MTVSDISARCRALLNGDPVFGLTERLADHLAPLFAGEPSDLPTGRVMASAVIASYHPQTPADFISIARSVAFSMSALAALSKAASADLSPALQLRYLGRANTLQRSADQSERAMERRQRQLQLQAPVMPRDGCPPQSDVAEVTLGDAEMAAHLADLDATVAAAVQESFKWRSDITSAIANPAGKLSDLTEVAPASPDEEPPPGLVPSETPRVETAAGVTTERRVSVGQAIPIIQVGQRSDCAKKLTDDMIQAGAYQQIPAVGPSPPGA